MVAVGVLQVPDVRRRGDEHASFPRRDAGGPEQAVGEDVALVEPAVAVGVAQQPHRAQRRLAGPGACRDSRASRRRRDCRRRRRPRRPGSAPGARPRPAPCWKPSTVSNVFNASSGVSAGSGLRNCLSDRRCGSSAGWGRSPAASSSSQSSGTPAAGSPPARGPEQDVARLLEVVEHPAFSAKLRFRCVAICSSIRATRRSSDSRGRTGPCRRDTT